MPRSETAAPQQCLEASLQLLPLVLAAAAEVVMPKEDWLVHWLVPSQLGRARCRILVSAILDVWTPYLGTRLTAPRR